MRIELSKIIICVVALGVGITSVFVVNSVLAYQKSTDIESRIGDMIMVGFRGTSVSEGSKIVQALKDLKIGGVILFDYDVPSKTDPRNIINPEQTKALITDLKRYSDKPLFVALDAEGGYVNRLKEKYGFIPVPSAQVLGERNDPDYTEKVYTILAKQLQLLGFNLNFAPVVDVNINPENPIIGYLERSYSSDPEIVTTHAQEAITAFHNLGIYTALKHFPGHGSSDADSHLGLVDVTKTYNKDIELAPYKNIIAQQQPDMIMTAHIVNTEIDPEFPATLSKVFLQEWLRGELGYTGVIVSDDMQMGAIVDHYGFDEAIIQAINAGVDLLVFSNNNRDYDEDIAYKAVAVIKHALQTGAISKEQIIEASDRIRALKKSL